LELFLKIVLAKPMRVATSVSWVVRVAKAPDEANKQHAGIYDEWKCQINNYVGTLPVIA
jgi:hypothetical protein